MKDATHIAVLLDRSGSMDAVKDETISGFNYFLKEQKAAGDNASLTLVQFDNREPCGFDGFDCPAVQMTLQCDPALDEGEYILCLLVDLLVRTCSIK